MYTEFFPGVLIQRALTVLLVHQDLEGVRFIVLKCLPDLLRGVLLRELSIHETRRHTQHDNTSRTTVGGWQAIAYIATGAYTCNMAYNVSFL